MVGLSCGLRPEPYFVKNTFIEVDIDFFGDDGVDIGSDAFPGKRQVSEPAFVTGRQAVSHQPTQLDIVRELPGMEIDSPVKSSSRGRASSARNTTWSTGSTARQTSGSGCDDQETRVEASSSSCAAEAADCVADDLCPALGSPSAAASPWASAAPEPKFEVDQAAFSPIVNTDLQGDCSRNSPASMGMGQPADASPDWRDVFTLMVRNLPNRYSQQTLLEDVASAGFDGDFDFFYLPIDPDTSANKGYAFINFVDADAAWRFKCTFEGTRMARFNSHKLISVSPAALQGLEANYAHYSTARCSRGHVSTRPLFLRQPEGVGAGCRTPNSRRGGQRRRSNGTSVVDVAAAKQSERSPGQSPAQLPQQMPPQNHIQYDSQTVPQLQHWVPQVFNQQPQAMKRFCPHCGGSVMLNHRFCPYCGEALVAPRPPAEIPPTSVRDET